MHVRRVYATNVVSQSIDLAPMLDFIVNLLVFFIVTAVFVHESGVSVDRPRNSNVQPERETWTVVVDEAGRISIGGRAVDLRAVRANIERLVASGSAGTVVIVAAPRAPTGALVNAVDQIRLGGVDKITFGTVAQ